MHLQGLLRYTRPLSRGPVAGSEIPTLKAAWVELSVYVYGPHGLSTERQDIVLPLKDVAEVKEADIPWNECPHAQNVKTASIPSHLLTHLDSPVCCCRNLCRSQT